MPKPKQPAATPDTLEQLLRTTAEKIGTTLGNLAVQTGFVKPAGASKPRTSSKARPTKKAAPSRSKKTVAKKAASKPAAKKRAR